MLYEFRVLVGFCCFIFYAFRFCQRLAMACSLNTGSNPSALNKAVLHSRNTRFLAIRESFGSSQFMVSKLRSYPSLSYVGKQLSASDQRQRGRRDWSSKATNTFSAKSTFLSRSMRWWEKNIKSNMIEIHSAQQLVGSLLFAGDRLVIIDFYSPGCGGCKAIHPKICQLAETNPDAIFLSVNYEQLNVMCKCLNIRVLPFFKFYKGSEGRLCSFSCTNATIKKFKDALTRYGAERCSLGPAKGLGEPELEKLVSAGELSSNYQLPSTNEIMVGDMLAKSIDLSGNLNKADNSVQLGEESVLL